MELVHKLNGVVIDEPIGCDDLNTTIKRHEYHGMSAEVSVGTLEFYGKAAHMIHDAYNTDIDTELKYEITDDGYLIYSGVIDLTTYNEHSGDYFTVSCKVGEVGIKTTFNNRTEVEVDLNKQTTMGGKPLAHIPEWKNLAIPYRTIQYINEQKQVTTTTYKKEPATGNIIQLPDDFAEAWLNLALDTNIKNEFGDMQPLMHIAAVENGTVAGYAEPFCTTNNGSTEDDESDIVVEVNLDCSIKFSEGAQATNMPFDNVVAIAEIEVMPVVKFNGNLRQTPSMHSPAIITNTNYTYKKTLTLSGTYTAKKKDLASIYVGLEFINKNTKNGNAYNNPSKFHVTINEGSYIRATLKSQLKDKVSADTILVKDALNQIVEHITDNEMSLSSSLYDIGDQIGYGALKAITNGYKIRGLKSDNVAERNMPVSFKSIIESLNSIDCIGWGFGKNEVIVENWDWFYQTQTLLSINGAKEKTRSLDESLIITELNIGYKKYTTAEDISSIDSIHGERTFTTTTSAISKSTSAMCEFIADNYSIEETRRAAITKEPDEEFKLDENIFIFALQRRNRDDEDIYFIIPRDITNEYSGTIQFPNEVYNAVISPTRNAYRWISRLFCVNGIKPFGLTKGTVNYQAVFKTKQTSGDVEFTPDGANNIPMLSIQTEDDSWQEDQNGENMSLQERYYTKVVEEDGVYVPKPSAGDLVIPRVFKAEELTVRYPISREQYKAIMKNPYGIVIVDGEKCWIKEMTYSFFKEEAEFKLTPKAN